MDEILKDVAAKLFATNPAMTMVAQIHRLSEVSITEHDQVMIVLQEYRRLQTAAKPEE